MNNLFLNEGIAGGLTKLPAALCEAGLFYLAAIDKDGYLTFTNTYFLKHFFSGYHAMDKKNILDLIHPDDRSLFKNLIGVCLSKACPKTAEVRVVNGACHRTEWEIMPLEEGPLKTERLVCIGYRINE